MSSIITGEAATLSHLNDSAQVIENHESILALQLTVDIQKHLYLKDHTFNKVSIVPATMILELFTEAATWFKDNYDPIEDKEYVVDSFKDLSIKRALALDKQDTLKAIILLDEVEQITDGYCFKMSINSERINKKGKVVGIRLISSVRVFLKKERRKAEQFKLPENVEFNYYQSDISKKYSLTDSHGPMLQGRTGKFALSKDFTYIISEYDCQDKEKSYIKGQESVFILSPLGYDCTLQSMMVLCIYQMSWLALPTGVEELIVYKKHPPLGRCKTLVEFIGSEENEFICNITAFDHNNEVIMKAYSFKMQRAFYSSVTKEDLLEAIKHSLVEKLDW